MTQNGHVVGERLIGYLYDEVDAGERAAVAAHLSACAVCASELAGLGATRHKLAGWAPPDVALGFQITRAASSANEPAPAPSATVLRPARWWRPLPAWAQAVAAAAIFAIGLAIGGSWSGAVPDQAVSDQAASDRPAQSQAAPLAEPMPVTGPATDSAVRRVTTADAEGLAQQIAALRAEVATLRSASLTSRASAGSASDARLEELIAASEANMRTELSLRLTQLARDVELARRSDRDEWNRTFNVTNQQTGAVMRQQRQDIEGLAKVVSQVAPR